MIRDLSKSSALLNAQSVMSAAVFFGHGEVSTLSVGDSKVRLDIQYDYSWHVEEREREWLLDRVVCGVIHSLTEDREVNTFTIHLEWNFNPNLR